MPYYACDFSQKWGVSEIIWVLLSIEEKEANVQHTVQQNPMKKWNDENDNSMLSIKYSPIKERWFDRGMCGDTAATIPGLQHGPYPINPALKGFKPQYFNNQDTDDQYTRPVPTAMTSNLQKELLTMLTKADKEDTGIDFLSDLENEEFDQQKLIQLLDKIEKENTPAANQ